MPKEIKPKPKRLEQHIIFIYQKRQKAHDLLLECDIELDKLFKKYFKK